MKILTSIVMLLIIIVLASCFGYSQAIIFPKEQYGCLSLFTSFIGGSLIGWMGARTLTSYD
jgi:hypothetical protein